ncbi:MAG TPA: hypothetical protein VFA07_04280 [Chthonomonadaceae bacterium]|nr:hypothetical protein [Chthonomonadaceae bacterium]
MATTTWKPEYTAQAIEIWEAYQQQHDLSSQRGKVAAIDPESKRVWIGDTGVDIAEQMKAEGVEVPVYLVRVDSNHFIQKGCRLSKSLLMRPHRAMLT